MIKQYDVLTFGDICMDLIISGKDVVPEFGQKEKLIDGYAVELGGSCPIFAGQAGKLGLRVLMAGRAGCDAFGDIACKKLAAAGVSLDCIKREKNIKTGITVHLNKGNDRAMLTYAGTMDLVEASDVDEEMLCSVRHLHIGSYFLLKKLQPHYPGIIRKIKAQGGTVSLDTNWDPDEVWDGGIRNILPYVDVLLPNENEAKALAGEMSVEKAIEKLRAFVPVIALKKGKDGAVTYTKDGIYHTPSYDVPTVDAIGAGDSFDAGFIYGYLSGRDIGECARMGCICGSLNTRAPGGMEGQPLLDELKKYLSK